jgi:outer membrane protein TolC
LTCILIVPLALWRERRLKAIAIALAMFFIPGCVLGHAQTLPAYSQTTQDSSGPLLLGPSQNSAQQQNPFFGSVVADPATTEVLKLSLLDAIDRGLKHNLGLLLSDAQTEAARGIRLRALSDVLPTLTGRLSDSVQQINLAAFGFPLPPGTPQVVGPFGVFDARFSFSDYVLDFKALNNARAGAENVRAAQDTYRNARELVVLAVGSGYLQALAAASRVEAVQAQLSTAQALLQQARDMKNSGMVAGIDVLRAQVEVQAQQQRLVSARNVFEKTKLSLGRTIGLSPAQPFELTDKLPYKPLPEVTLEQALERAYQSRNDYQAAVAQVQAAELTRKAAIGEALPTLQLNADYGAIGPNPGQSRATYSATAGLKVPIFQGGKVRGDTLQADAALKQRRAEAADLRSRIEYEVRSAFLDLQAASDQVQVAQQTVQLSGEELKQAQDRFSAGVSDNLEVVQAQQAVAAANDNYIDSLNAHNIAKLLLARALGVAEQQVKAYLKGND